MLRTCRNRLIQSNYKTVSHNRKRLRIEGSGKHPNYQMMSLSKVMILHLMGCVLMTTIAPAISCKSQGYILKEARYVPQNQREYWELTKDIKCSPSNLKVTYLINTWRNETIVGCFCNFEIYGGYCAELNIGSEVRVQANHAAPCHNFTITPCKLLYNSSESYLIRQCFEEYGKISSARKLFLENENLRRIENDQKKVIEKQIYSLSDQIRENVKLKKIIQKLNMTNIELASELKDKRFLTEKQSMTIMDLTNKLNNKEQCENTGLGIPYFLLALVIFIILGYVLLFLTHKYIFKVDFTFSEFCHWRMMLLKGVFLPSNNQEQLLPSFISATNNQNTLETDSEHRTEVGNNKYISDISRSIAETSQSTANKDSYSMENADTISLKNENETRNELGEVTNDYHHEGILSAEDAALLSENVTHRDRNDVQPEERQFERENAAVNLQQSIKITERVHKMEQKI